MLILCSTMNSTGAVLADFLLWNSFVQLYKPLWWLHQGLNREVFVSSACLMCQSKQQEVFPVLIEGRHTSKRENIVSKGRVYQSVKCWSHHPVSSLITHYKITQGIMAVTLGSTTTSCFTDTQCTSSKMYEPKQRTSIFMDFAHKIYDLWPKHFVASNPSITGSVYFRILY